MTWQRVGAGLVSGLVALVPLGLIALLTGIGALRSTDASPLAVAALPLGVLVGGALAGYLAGQGRRRRREVKAVVGAAAGIFAALLLGGALEAALIVRAMMTPIALRTDVITMHPIRVTAANLLLSTLVVGLAMLTCHLTARPLPPPRLSRRLTGQVPVVPRQPREP